MFIASAALVKVTIDSYMTWSEMFTAAGELGGRLPTRTELQDAAVRPHAGSSENEFMPVIREDWITGDFVQIGNDDSYPSYYDDNGNVSVGKYFPLYAIHLLMLSYERLNLT